MDFIEFCEKAREYCHVLGGSVQSWIRTVDHNAAVGGVPASRHLLGLAVDVTFDAPKPPDDQRRECAAALGLHLLIEHSHDHIEAGPA